MNISINNLCKGNDYNDDDDDDNNNNNNNNNNNDYNLRSQFLCNFVYLTYFLSLPPQ